MPGPQCFNTQLSGYFLIWCLKRWYMEVRILCFVVTAYNPMFTLELKRTSSHLRPRLPWIENSLWEHTICFCFEGDGNYQGPGLLRNYHVKVHLNQRRFSTWHRIGWQHSIRQLISFILLLEISYRGHRTICHGGPYCAMRGRCLIANVSCSTSVCLRSTGTIHIWLLKTFGSIRLSHSSILTAALYPCMRWSSA